VVELLEELVELHHLVQSQQPLEEMVVVTLVLVLEEHLVMVLGFMAILALVLSTVFVEAGLEVLEPLTQQTESLPQVMVLMGMAMVEQVDTTLGFLAQTVAITLVMEEQEELLATTQDMMAVQVMHELVIGVNYGTTLRVS
jgi:hypothetical protein